MNMFTQRMRMLTAVVMDSDREKVVKALLEKGVMEFVHIDGNAGGNSVYGAADAGGMRLAEDREANARPYNRRHLVLLKLDDAAKLTVIVEERWIGFGNCLGAANHHGTAGANRGDGSGHRDAVVAAGIDRAAC